MTTSLFQDELLSRELQASLSASIDKAVVRKLVEQALHGFDFSDLIDAIEEHFEPDEVFTLEKLERWATDHGYAKVAP